MSPRRAEEPNVFQEAQYNFEDTINEPPVSADEAFEVIQELEMIGKRAFSEKFITAKNFAGTLHKAYVELGEAELEPPMSPERVELVAGKVATYAAMLEAAQPKSPKEAKATDTDKIETAKAK